MKQERMKLENTSRSWKILITQYCIENFPTSIGTFQLKWKFSNFKISNYSFFPSALSNFINPPTNHVQSAIEKENIVFFTLRRLNKNVGVISSAQSSIIYLANQAFHKPIGYSRWSHEPYNENLPVPRESFKIKPTCGDDLILRYSTAS